MKETRGLEKRRGKKRGRGKRDPTMNNWNDATGFMNIRPCMNSYTRTKYCIELSPRYNPAPLRQTPGGCLEIVRDGKRKGEDCSLWSEVDLSAWNKSYNSTRNALVLSEFSDIQISKTINKNYSALSISEKCDRTSCRDNANDTGAL